MNKGPIRFIALVLLTFTLLFVSCGPVTGPPEEDYYYPPVSGDAWETQSPANLGWDGTKLDELIAYVQHNNSTAFIILHKGKIVVEEYWKNWDIHSTAIIYSAEKSVCSFLVGIAQEKGYLSIDDKVSKYLGNGWTKASIEKEDSITIRHLLTMTSGLTGGAIPASGDLRYQYDAGTWWQYNTSTQYQLVHAVAEATGSGWGQIDIFAREVLWSRIGMQDSHWGVLSMTSSARDMARFGLMILGNGQWNGEDIIKDKDYLTGSFTPLDLNPQYGYLWWLNTDANLIRSAPRDLVAALGMYNKYIYIVPSLNLVVVRHGDAASSSSFASEIWQRLMEILPVQDTN